VRADARILRVSGVIDPATRLVTVRASVANAAGKLRPETFATVRVTTAEPRPGVTLPHDAVQMIDAKPAAFISQPDGKGGAKFIRREVVRGTPVNGPTHTGHGVPLDRMHVVPVGVDQDLFRPLDHVARVPGRLIPTASADVTMKGLRYLPEAIAKLWQANDRGVAEQARGIARERQAESSISGGEP